MKTKMLQIMVVSFLALGFGVSGGFAQTAKMPAVGDSAPLVSGRNQDGQEWKLVDARGKKVVLLYFYTKDDTPGCTKEACGLRDSMGDLQKSDVEVVGVSFDDAASHKAFIAKHNLNFALIADTDGKIADAFGVRVPDKNRARRVSFLIGKDGKILHVTDSPSADVHLAEMKEAVGKLQKKD
jgi:peroxiredoxin Q/BCP